MSDRWFARRGGNYKPYNWVVLNWIAEKKPVRAFSVSILSGFDIFRGTGCSSAYNDLRMGL
jgi:hypothetical protein